MDNGNTSGARAPILVLGGTGESRFLAALLNARGQRVITSLAGRTAQPLLPRGEVRIGGFGGADGLASYLLDAGVQLVVDATHPFAKKISTNAAEACHAVGVPLIRLERPAWTPYEGESWITVDSISGAAASLPAGARVFLTVGRQEVAQFYGHEQCQIVARMIDVPNDIPKGWSVIAARGPFDVAQELETFQAHNITHLVSKNSGGPQTAAKLEAARRLEVKVIMVARPELPVARTVPDVQSAMAVIEDWQKARRSLGGTAEPGDI